MRESCEEIGWLVNICRTKVGDWVDGIPSVYIFPPLLLLLLKLSDKKWGGGGFTPSPLPPHPWGKRSPPGAVQLPYWLLLEDGWSRLTGEKNQGENGSCTTFPAWIFRRNIRPPPPNRASSGLFLIEPVHCQACTDLLGFFGNSIPLCCSDYAATIFVQRV